MSRTPSPSPAVPNEVVYAMAAALAEEVERLLPEFLQDPIDREKYANGVAVVVIDQCGRIHGRIFGEDKGRGRWCFGIATRKVAQVWQTGCARPSPPAGPGRSSGAASSRLRRCWLGKSNIFRSLWRSLPYILRWAVQGLVERSHIIRPAIFERPASPKSRVSY